MRTSPPPGGPAGHPPAYGSHDHDALNSVCYATLGFDEPWRVESYERVGGYEAWWKILAGKIPPESVPSIIRNGGDWFMALGRPNNGGLKCFSVSGHVNRPGNFEVPLGTPFRRITGIHMPGSGFSSTTRPARRQGFSYGVTSHSRMMNNVPF